MGVAHSILDAGRATVCNNAMGAIINVFNPSNELVKVDLMDSDKETRAWSTRKPMPTAAKRNKGILSYNFPIKSIEISSLL